ncbi:uncharacterized protein LOC118436201 [Folsomia candida]|uniref:uncharacterized protein LOC118436201 n=1 Tax=Folsomia candida TaxID=158441 RepID=UPI001605427C|nr:uncharacterized protein LOC118436201 [Folsomia candida]
MTCAICLETYMDFSQTPYVEEDRLPFQCLTTSSSGKLSQEPDSATQTSNDPGLCCFPPFLRPARRVEVEPEPLVTDVRTTVCKNKPLHETAPVATKCCGHVFHLACISSWMQALTSPNNECPMCREPVDLENLVKLRLECPMSIIRQETAVGVLVSMSLNQYNHLKTGFTVGYRAGMERWKEEYQQELAKVQKEGLKEVAKLRHEYQQQIQALTVALEPNRNLQHKAESGRRKWCKVAVMNKME